MAYQTGSATSHVDLVQQLAAWLVTQGWTVNDSAADGAGWRAHLNKGGWFLHLKVSTTGSPHGAVLYPATIPSLFCYMSTAYAGIGASYNASLTGAPLGTDGPTLGVGIVVNSGANAAFHFFHDGGDHYTIVIERSLGLHQVLGFGLSLVKHGGNWSGGPYIHGQMCGGYTGSAPQNDDSYCPFHHGSHEYGVNTSAFVRADVDSFTGNWISIGPTATNEPRRGWTGRRGYSGVRGQSDLPADIPHTHALASCLVSSINAQAVLLPIRIFAATGAGGACLIGTAPSVFQSNAVGNGYLAGAEIQLGADTYKLFPNFAVRKVA